MTRPRPPAPHLPLVAWLSSGSITMLLLVHLTMTFLHVTPINPVKVEFETAVTRWTQPLFNQNWKLFAPDPISVDHGVLVRAELLDGTTTEFVDIVTPYLEDKHHNLLPSRAGYQVSGVVTRYLEVRDQVIEEHLSPEERDDAQLFLDQALLADVEGEVRTYYDQALRDVRDSAVHHLGVPAEQIRSVQLRFVQHEFPRFSQRHDTGTGEIFHSSSPWLSPKGDL